MRILIINYEFPPLGGGAGYASSQIARHLAGFGNEVAVLTSAYRGLPVFERRDGYQVRRVPVVRRRVDRCSLPEMATFIAGALVPALLLARSFRPHIAVVFFGVPTGPLGWVLKKALGLPYILSLRGGDVPGFLQGELGMAHRLLGPMTSFVWDNASVVVANSKGLSELAMRSYTKGSVEVIPNGVDTDFFHPTSDSKGEGSRFRILFAGRLVEQKGAKYLIECLPYVSRCAPMPVELEIVGEGTEEAELRSLIQRLGLAGQVKISGWLDRATLGERYQKADVFALPSFEEGMPNVVLEAMASGLPVVTTDIYGTRGLVRSGENGFLVSTGDSVALGEAIGRLVEQPGLRMAMGRRSREIAEEYSWEATARAYLGLCQNVLHGYSQELPYTRKKGVLA